MGKLKRSLPLFLLSAGFALVSLLQSNFLHWWLWVILVILQIPPYILDWMINKNVSLEIVEEAKRRALADWREERLRAASQASSTSGFAASILPKGAELQDRHARSDHIRHAPSQQSPS